MKAKPFACCIVLLLLNVISAVGQEPDYTKPIVEKAIRAIGDSKKQEKMQGLTLDVKGKLKVNDSQVELSGNLSFQELDAGRADLTVLMNGENINAILTVQAKKGRLQVNNGGANDMPDLILGILQYNLRALRLIQRPTLLKSAKFKLSPLGETRIGDVETVGLQIKEKGYPDLDVFYDKKSGLPVRAVTRVKDTEAGQESTHSFTVKDFQVIEGLKHFRRLTFQRNDDQVMEMDLSNMRWQESIDRGVFNLQ